MLDNPRAKYAEEPMEQWLQRTVISFEMVKADQLKHMITEFRRYALPVTRRSTKAQSCQSLNVLRRGKKHTDKLLAGYLRTDILK